LMVIALPAVALPIVVDQSWFAGTGHPVLSLIPMLAKTVGLPFFALATTAPLMQRWFATVAPNRDPYPLYAASNAGSLLAFAAYCVALAGAAHRCSCRLVRLLRVVDRSHVAVVVGIGHSLVWVLRRRAGVSRRTGEAQAAGRRVDALLSVDIGRRSARRIVKR